MSAIAATLPYATLPVAEVLSRAEAALEAAELGALAGTLADAVGCARGARALLFLATFGLWPRLRDGEFVAGFGARRLAPAAARLLRLTGVAAATPGAAARALLALLGAGALDAADLLTPRALVALHGALRARGSAAAAAAAAPPAAAAEAAAAAAAVLLRGIISEMDGFASAGVFIAAFFASDACELPLAAQRDVMARVCASADVRDLAGSPRALMDALPAHALAIAEALAAADDDSDADDAGNLAGFVDDEIAYSSTDSAKHARRRARSGPAPSAFDDSSDDSSSEDDDDDKDGGSSDTSGNSADDAAASSSSESAPVIGRKRLRQPPAAAAARARARHADTGAAARYIDAEARR